MTFTVWLWSIFPVFVLGLLALDVGKFRPLSTPPNNLWAWALLVAVSLAVFSVVVSIRSGPSVQHAAHAILMAQNHVSAACGVSTGRQPPALQSAETELSLAYAAFAERRYDAAVTAASGASRLARHCTPESSSRRGSSSEKTIATS